MTGVRVASWNLNQRTGEAAARLGSLLAAQGGADLVLLQEVSQGGLPRFCEAAGLDWFVHLREEFFDLLSVRGRASGWAAQARCVAIAGRGERMRGATVFPDLPLPEKVLAGWIDMGGVRTTVVSFHAPVGGWGLVKPRQAVRLAEWLACVDGPVVFAGDFNTPWLDPPDFDRVRTHWHTGDTKMGGALGDDLLVGPAPVHGLRDALRTFLGARPDELQAIRAARPDGPLALSYCKGERDDQRCRYDAVWLSDHFEVDSVEYLYEESVAAGTDHALVLVDATLTDASSAGVV